MKELGRPNNKDAADRAYERLHLMFFMPYSEENTKSDVESSKRLLLTIGTFFKLTVRAAYEGMNGGEHKAFIKNGLKKDALIDPEDPLKADEQYKVISEGYYSRMEYWNAMLGRAREYRNFKRESYEIR